MHKSFQSTILLFSFFVSNLSYSQVQKGKDFDIEMKDSLYAKFKKEVQAFDKNDFDSLFFEFFSKQNDENLLLTKEEYYTFTIKIAIYSEKLGLLYKEQKDTAQKTKQLWFDKRYSDYLESKKP